LSLFKIAFFRHNLVVMILLLGEALWSGLYALHSSKCFLPFCEKTKKDSFGSLCYQITVPARGPCDWKGTQIQLTRTKLAAALTEETFERQISPAFAFSPPFSRSCSRPLSLFCVCLECLSAKRRPENPAAVRSEGRGFESRDGSQVRKPNLCM
jgi:hypothetical protein